MGKWRKGWECLGLLQGFSLNETRCVVGPVRGALGKKMGGHVCVNLWVVPPAIWTDLEFWNLGRRPGICILGGQGEGVWRAEDGSAGGQGGGGGGVRMGCPSLSRSLSLSLALSRSLSLSPSLCMCSAAPAVGLPTHSLRVIQAGV